jgi:hypothetical protein
VTTNGTWCSLINDEIMLNVELCKFTSCVKKAGVQNFYASHKKLRDVMAKRAEIRELTENARVSSEMRKTWHVCSVSELLVIVALPVANIASIVTFA